MSSREAKIEGVLRAALGLLGDGPMLSQQPPELKRKNPNKAKQRAQRSARRKSRKTA